MILGKKIGQGDIAGAIPEAPAAWGYQSHCLTGSGVSPWVFTAPERGWYRFYLIGPGGAGGTMPNTISAGDDYTSFCGAGGSGGSLSGHKYYCTTADAPIKAILGKGGVGAGNMESVHEMSDSNGNRHVSFGPTPQPQGGFPGGVIVETAAK